MPPRARRQLRPLLLVIALVAGCGSPGATATPSEGPGNGATGTLSIAWEGDIASLDPSQGYDYISWPAERLIFETLVAYGDSTDLVPQLAADMPAVSDDGLVYTFTLRDGVNFVSPDGSIHRQMTADDVVHSLNRILNPDLTPTPSPVSGAFFVLIEGGQAVIDGEADEASGLTAVDEMTVEIRLEEPNVAFLNILAMPFASIVPADLADEDTEAFAEEPVGTGPYTLESYTVGDVAVFVRNPHYWGDAPPTDRVELRFGIDTNTAVQQVQANQLDIMGDPIPAGMVNSLREDPQYADRVVVFDQVAIAYLSMDTSAPDSPLSDVDVRRAINHAVDKENLIQVLAGRGEVAHCILPPPVPGHNPDCRPYEYDPDLARDLLAEAGHGEFATTLYTDNTEDSTAVAQAIQQDLADVGITVEIVTQSFDELIGTITVPHQAPLVYIQWFQDFPDPSDFIDPILSCAAAVEGGSNSSWYCSEEIDELAAEARPIQDPGERLAMYGEIERLIMDDAPWVPLFFPAIDTFISERVVNFSTHPVWFVDLAKYEVRD